MKASSGFRLLGLMQLVAALIFILSSFGIIASFVAIPRKEALARVRDPIPEDWEWVFISHGRPYHWPYRGGTPLFVACWLATFVFLVISGFHAGGWKFRRT